MAGKSIDQEIVYEEFEPFCKWLRKEDRDVLEIELQEFKKEQLKVQISNQGVLKISGERQVEQSKGSKRLKFYKEVPAPNTKYDTHAIHAKFVNNHLIITLPKRKPEADKASPSEPPATKSREDKDEKAPSHVEGNVLTGQCHLKCRKRPTVGDRLAKVAASLAVTAVVAVLLAAYVRYMYKSTVDQ